MKYTRTQEFMAEFLGTLVLLLLGCGSVAMVGLFGSTPAIPGEIVKGGYTNIVFGWALAVTFGIYISGSISGAHLNPAVTIAMAATNRISWTKVPHYILAQFLGSFCATALVFAVYYPKWITVDAKFDHTANVLCTFPAVTGFWLGFFDQVVGSAIFLGLVLAVVDKLNARPGANLAPFVIGFIVMAIGISFGGMNGYAINPARDLGARLFTVVMGFKNNGLTDGPCVWLPPVIGPIVGGLLGAFAYDLTIGRVLVNTNIVNRDPGDRAKGMHCEPYRKRRQGQDLKASSKLPVGMTQGR